MDFNRILERKFRATIQEKWLCIACKEFLTNSTKDEGQTRKASILK
jgi:hypothetical protein